MHRVNSMPGVRRGQGDKEQVEGVVPATLQEDVIIHFLLPAVTAEHRWTTGLSYLNMEL